MYRMNRQQFEELVLSAIEALPDQFLARLDNVAVVVEDEASAEQMRRNGLGPDDVLYGLYEGVPLVDRHDYSMVMPDKITIFQRPIEAICDDRNALLEEVQATVVHEVAHFFGISDEELHEMGLG